VAPVFTLPVPLQVAALFFLHPFLLGSPAPRHCRATSLSCPSSYAHRNRLILKFSRHWLAESRNRIRHDIFSARLISAGKSKMADASIQLLCGFMSRSVIVHRLPRRFESVIDEKLALSSAVTLGKCISRAIRIVGLLIISFVKK